MLSVTLTVAALVGGVTVTDPMTLPTFSLGPVTTTGRGMSRLCRWRRGRVRRAATAVCPAAPTGCPSVPGRRPRPSAAGAGAVPRAARRAFPPDPNGVCGQAPRGAVGQAGEVAWRWRVQRFGFMGSPCLTAERGQRGARVAWRVRRRACSHLLPAATALHAPSRSARRPFRAHE